MCFFFVYDWHCSDCDLEADNLRHDDDGTDPDQDVIDLEADRQAQEARIAQFSFALLSDQLQNYAFVNGKIMISDIEESKDKHMPLSLCMTLSILGIRERI